MEPNLQLNLLANGNFDHSSPTGQPIAWEREVAAGSVNQIWDSTRYVSPGHSIKTIMYTGGQADWRQLVTEIQSDTQYRFRAHIYATNVTPDAHSVELQWFNDTNYLGRTTLSSTVPNQWVEVIGEDITPPSEANSVWVLLRSYAPGAYSFDDIVLLRKDENLWTINGEFPMGLYSLTDIDLLYNNDFETSLGGDANLPASWNRNVAAGIVEQTWTSEQFLSGSHAVKTVMASAGQADWRQRVTDIETNLRYRFRASINVTNIAPGSHSASLQWFSADDVFLGQNILMASTTNEWVTVSAVDIVPPPDAVYAWILLRTYQAGTYYFDDVFFEVDWTSVEHYSEARKAGFNFVNCFAEKLDTVASANLKAGLFLQTNYLPDGADPTTLMQEVNTSKQHPALAIWVGRDEPAWESPQKPPQAIINAYNIIRATDSSAHPIWLNHAPRGTQDCPNGFELLQPYTAGANIVSMDIYPIPAGNGHANLKNQSSSVVGDYTDILYNQVVTLLNVQQKPVWMVLQGFGWADLWRAINQPQQYTHAIELQWFDSNNEYLKRDIFPSDQPNRWYLVDGENIQPPPTAAKVWVLLRSYQPGIYYFDNLTFGLQGGENLLLNSDFESGIDGALLHWSQEVDTGLAAQAWDASWFVSGAHSVKTAMTSAGQADWRQLVTEIDPTQRYSMSGFIYAQTQPTWEETRFMAYNAIIHGARGIVYWGNDCLSVNSAMWKDLKRIATELRLLSPTLVSPTSFRAVQTENQIETLLLQSSTELYLLAANRSAEFLSANIAVTGLPLAQANEIFENRKLSLLHNTFRDSFASYQVHVYRIK